MFGFTKRTENGVFTILDAKCSQRGTQKHVCHGFTDFVLDRPTSKKHQKNIGLKEKVMTTFINARNWCFSASSSPLQRCYTRNNASCVICFFAFAKGVKNIMYNTSTPHARDPAQQTSDYMPFAWSAEAHYKQYILVKLSRMPYMGPHTSLDRKKKLFLHRISLCRPQSSIQISILGQILWL